MFTSLLHKGLLFHSAVRSRQLDIQHHHPPAADLQTGSTPRLCNWPPDSLRGSGPHGSVRVRSNTSSAIAGNTGPASHPEGRPSIAQWCTPAPSNNSECWTSGYIKWVDGWMEWHKVMNQVESSHLYRKFLLVILFNLKGFLCHQLDCSAKKDSSFFSFFLANSLKWSVPVVFRSWEAETWAQGTKWRCWGGG